MSQEKTSDEEYIPTPREVPDELTDELKNTLIVAADLMHFKEGYYAVRAGEVAIHLVKDSVNTQYDLDVINGKGYLGKHQMGSSSPYYTLSQEGKNKVAKVKKKLSKIKKTEDC